MNRAVTGRVLYLRELCRDDLDRTWEWLHRPDINRRIGVMVPFSKSRQVEWFNGLSGNASKMVFAVCLIQDGSHIGNVSLDMIDERHRNARFSIFIADRSNRGRGYGSEALSLLEEYAFSVLGLHRIWCKTDAEEPELLRFYLDRGYTREGLLREHELKDGVFVDKVLFGKTESDGKG